MLSTVAKAVSLALLVAASPVTNNATATVTGVGIANNATTTAAQPVANNATLPPPGPIPRATINSSNEQVTFHGVANQGYDEFLGIPFAEPRKYIGTMTHVAHATLTCQRSVHSASNLPSPRLGTPPTTMPHLPDPSACNMALGI
jgi:hypothetical protein